MNETEWKVFTIGDCDFYVARSKEEARETFKREMEADDEEMAEYKIIELTDKDLQEISFYDEDNPNLKKTCAEELELMIKSGHLKEPCMFASTEY